ncbi:MAG: acyltransferase [Magnetococcales bacterium]|nr:acyltransferase [Magnetococcales bacterium]
MNDLNTIRKLQVDYRPDIDGLRAIAVLAVVGYHAFPYFFTGGFIGVDVFFVISGFLITKIIKSKLDKNAFSVVDFYKSRIVRIFPALIVMLAAVYIFGYLSMHPNEFRRLGWHILGSATFIANFILPDNKIDNYFGEFSSEKPLLNLWSLGVEGQFYLIYPIFIYLAWKRKINFVTYMYIGASLSFGMMTHFKSDNIFYYSPGARFFELLSGCILAINDSTSRSASSNSFKSIAGVLLIILSVFLIHKKQSLMAWALVMPIVGSVLIISSGPSTWINQTLLSNRIAVWFGIISYPLYLWHWPILAFQKILVGDTPSKTARLLACIISIFLAWLTYRYVEIPIRYRGLILHRTRFLLIAMFFLSLIGYITYSHDGIPSRNPTRIVYPGELGTDDVFLHFMKIGEPCKPKHLYDNSEKLSISARELTLNRCFQSINKPIRVALIGDSHAEHLFIGFAENDKLPGVVYFTRPGFPPVSDRTYSDIFRHLFYSPEIEYVVLSSLWSLPTPWREKKFEVDLQTAIDYLIMARKKIIILEDTPKFSIHPVNCKLSRNIFPSSLCNEHKIGSISDHHNKYIKSMKTVVKNNSSVQFIETIKHFCNAENCSMTANNQLLFYDEHHLNINGSRFLLDKIIGELPCGLRICK